MKRSFTGAVKQKISSSSSPDTSAVVVVITVTDDVGVDVVDADAIDDIDDGSSVDVL